jgi:hypothetical protein
LNTELKHFLEPEVKISEEVLNYNVSKDTETLLNHLQGDFPNNLMLKGYPGLNVPLYKTLNYHSAVSHTSQLIPETGEFEKKPITGLLLPKSSEFFASVNHQDGSVNVWNSDLHLFLSSRVSFKEVNQEFNREFQNLQKKDEKLMKEIRELEEENSRLSSDSSEEPQPTPEKVYEEIVMEKDTPVKPKVAPGQDFDDDSELEEEEEKKQPNEEENKQATLEDPKPSTPPSVIKTKAKSIIFEPNHQYLNDLINMGFSKEESTKALEAVKNESIELAVEKVFELKESEAKQQEVYMQSLAEDSIKKEKEKEEQEKQKQAEEQKKKEKEDKMLKNQEIINEKQAQKEQKEEKIQKMKAEIELVKSREIIDFAMTTSTEPSLSPIMLSAMVKSDSKHFLCAKTLSYHPRYIEKLTSKHVNSEKCHLDSYENISETPIADHPSEEMVNHLLSHCKFSVNTLMPLFVGYQSKANWKLEHNREPALIFKETSDKTISLEGFQEIYGI